METQARIAEGADQMFRKFGIRSVSMDDIASNLGISKKTIYNFFSNKSEVVFQVMTLHLEQEEQDFTDIHGKSSNPVEECILILGWLEKTMSQICPAMIYDVKKYYPETWDLFTEFKYKTIRKHIIDNLNKGIEQGLYRSDMNPEIIARLRLEEIEMGFNNEIFPASEFDARLVQMELLSQYFHGITTIKGRKLINKYLNVTEDESLAYETPVKS